MSQARLKTILALAAAGVIFAGSLTVRQMIAPATEPGIFSCVGLTIFGLSPCPYGLGLFLVIAATAYLLLKGRQSWLIWLRIFAVMGVLFSGWVVWRELCLPALLLGADYWRTLSLANLPACFWGFWIFILILILSLIKFEAISRPQ